MPPASPARIGYVLKMYPRFSETFIVNEILAHEAAGQEIEIFSLRPPIDGRFHESLARVRAPVTYLPGSGIKATDLWDAFSGAAHEIPNFAAALDAAWGEDMRDVYQAVILASVARARGITHLHAHFASSATSVARLAARLANLPYTFTAHAKDIFHESVQPDDLQRKLNDAAAVITVSDFNLAFLRATYGPAAARVERVYNGLDLAQFPYESPAARPVTIIAVGRLVEKKGFADLIDACAHLRTRGRAFQCAIVGAGPLEAELQAQIDRCGLGDRVRLLGPRPQGEVRQLIQSAAVFAAPCVIGSDGNRDGLPTVLLEAMALGTPCVATDVTGIPEVLRDGETGLMTPQHEPAALATRIERLLDDSSLRVRLSGAARQLIEAEFDISVNAGRIREIFARSTRPLTQEEG
jgi:colanic acid/amylovoran biosynthesis glycosyltransferase